MANTYPIIANQALFTVTFRLTSTDAKRGQRSTSNQFYNQTTYQRYTGTRKVSLFGVNVISTQIDYFLTGYPGNELTPKVEDSERQNNAPVPTNILHGLYMVRYKVIILIIITI